MSVYYSDDLVTLDVVSLFSGVGGIELAFERAGCTTRLLCERERLPLHLHEHL